MTEQRGFGLYFHWPFCRSKCPYCDFNSQPVTASLDQARWRAAWLTELDHWAALTADRTVSAVFFGGGTPSLAEPATIAAVLDRIARHWRLAPALEVSLEANPNSAEAARFAGFRRAGVNRLSLGVQALDDPGLRLLGRNHDCREALAALTLAERCFPRLSLDLIYARPGQSLAAWQQELTRAAALGTGHLSVYQLSVEAGTPFHQREVAGTLTLPDSDHAAALYETTQAVLEAAGLPAYEISNHARPDQSCRYNLLAWQGEDWLGIGPGAHGRLTRRDGSRLATVTLSAAADWQQQVEQRGHGLLSAEPLTDEERLTERVMMGLRLTAGLDRSAIRAEFGQDCETLLNSRALARLRAAGFLDLSPEHLAATPAGRLRLNALLVALLNRD